MRLTFFTLPGYAPTLRPAPLPRDWMEATPDRFAYRCLPLNIANAHGWEILAPAGFTAVWDGGAGREAITIRPDRRSQAHLVPVSHFGGGVLTFHIYGVVRTEPGYNLWVSGPVNRPKDAIQPLAGVIETDWAPYSFTMNWIFTGKDRLVRFQEGEPFCHFFPVPRDLVETVEPEVRPLESDPDLAAQHAAWSESRNSFIQDLPVKGSAAQSQSWQKTYFRGQMPDGTPGTRTHRTKLSLKPFGPPGTATGPRRQDG